MSVCSIIGCGATVELQEHHLSYDPEIKVVLCKTHHESYHGHGVGQGRREKVYAPGSFKNKRDRPPAGLFRLKRGSQGHYYIPGPIQSVVGDNVSVHSMGIAALLWNENAELGDVIESVDIIKRSIVLQASLMKV